MNNQTNKLKEEVYQYWNEASCGTELTEQKKFSKAYFEEIEAARYKLEPEIHSFAQFTRFHGKKVLEVGMGAGTDFLQWVRAGASAHGVDLTDESIDNVTHRLNVYDLFATKITRADAEKLPFLNNQFDLVYSWGVIHHSPNTEQCLKEIVRVTKPGGTIKVMIYNRHSLFAFYRYLLAGLLKGRPFSSFKKILAHNQESPGTKAYTFKEAKQMCENLPVSIISMTAPPSQHDLLYYKAKPFRFLAHCAALLRGWYKSGWFLMIELKKER
jgi:ubiquinone/menaquinone biosynthesis C-methylase UbiE